MNTYSSPEIDITTVVFVELCDKGMKLSGSQRDSNFLQYALSVELNQVA